MQDEENKRQQLALITKNGGSLFMKADEEKNWDITDMLEKIDIQLPSGTQIPD